MAERERMISQVETTVNEVKEIFSDLAVLISNQSESIDHISSAIENTAQKTRRANEELLDANRYQAQARKRKCCLYAAGLAGLIILLMVLFVNFRL
jgi:t-SNARE complex subunit (syntaxin)